MKNKETRKKGGGERGNMKERQERKRNREKETPRNKRKGEREEREGEIEERERDILKGKDPLFSYRETKNSKTE